jgi:hypothetical protein
MFLVDRKVQVLIMIKFLFAALFIPFLAQAQTMSTEQRGNIILTSPSGGDMSAEDYKARAQSVLNFVETKLYAKVPDALLAKIKAKTLHIEITNEIKKGGMFNPEKSKKGELLLQIRENLFADESLFRLLTHEWFHALHYVIHPDEPSWVREGMAQVFETMVLDGYNGPNLLSALESSTTPLEFAFDVGKVEREAYGHTFTYFYYLYKNCGGDATFWKITESAPGKFGADTLTSVLSGNPKKECSGFETTVLNAELARFHNRKVYGKTTTTDLYWLTGSFSRTVKTINEGLLDKVVVADLPPHQPLMLNKSYKSALRPFLKDPKLAIYTLSSTFPYLVTEGVTADSSTNDEILFLMRRK